MGRKELEAGNDSNGSKIKLGHTKSETNRGERSRKIIEKNERTRFNTQIKYIHCTYIVTPTARV